MRSAAVVPLLLSLLVSGPAHGALQWYPRQELPTGLTSLALSPDGVGLLFGFNAGGKRYIVRPVGGPLGAPQALPLGLNDSFSASLVAWFPDGSALLAQGSHVAFRPAGAAASIGTLQILSGFGVAGIAPAALGDALLASTGPVEVASRPSGEAALVDLANAQTLGSGTLIGVVQDPDGGGVVVFDDGNMLLQAVRAVGETTFATPTAIVAPGLGPSEYGVRMAADPSGHAVLGWLGASPSSTSFGDTIVAATRAPGGAFGTPVSIGTTPVEDNVYVLPGVTASGDGVVAWTQLNSESPCSPARDQDAGAYYASGRNGAWSAPTPLGGTAWPNVSGVEGVASAGNYVAIAFFTRHSTATRCTAADETDEILVRTGVSGATELELDGPVSIAQSYEVPAGHQNPQLIAIAVNPSGGALAAFSEGDGAGLYKPWLRARENLDGVPTPTVTPGGATPTVAPTPTVVVPPHVADREGAKAADKCAAGIAKAAGKFVEKKLAALAKCTDGLFACVQTKELGAKRDACTAKARAKCDAALAKADAEQSRLPSAVGKQCGALDTQDLTGPDGVGFGDLSAECSSRFGTPASDAANVAACVGAHHACTAATLLAIELPRARELLTLTGVGLPACLDGAAGPGLGADDAKVGKTLVKCHKAVEKSGLAFARKERQGLQKCIDGVFGCVQLKSDATAFPACLTKARAACDKGFAKIAASAAAIGPAIDKQCGGIGTGLLDASGLDLDAPTTVCTAHGVDSLASLADYEECLFRQHACLVEELIAFETPRAVEMLGLVGRELRSAFCPPPD